ncbi:MAG: adenine deaminase [Marinilabiliaceae bacterium]|nr:adenine deaminase [Marinilabiliaceae bacterium]
MIKNKFSVKGKIVDLFNRVIYSGEVFVEDGIIVKINKIANAPNQYILPGFVDSHVHVESSALIPAHFAEMIVPRGTIAVISDPHEIANVLGQKGIEFMIENAKTTPLKFFFGAPSCVPATNFETAGTVLDAEQVKKLLHDKDIFYLSEMMNYPGVIFDDPEVKAKIEAALKSKKKIDGHAPGLSGENLKKYANAGITTDHECSTLEEAIEKIKLGMKIQIREGSAAKNFHNLAPLFENYPDSLMLCTDDCHPDEIETEGHIDKIIQMGLKLNIDIFDLLRAASVIPIQHYNLPVGLCREVDKADFIVVKDLIKFKVLKSFIDGKLCYDIQKGNLFKATKVKPLNNFRNSKIELSQLQIQLPENKTKIKVIEVIKDELITSKFLWQPAVKNDRIVETDLKNDILKIVVLNRYEEVKPTVGFIKNFGLKQGALASSVAHDSHNIVAVGTDDTSITKAINLLIQTKGGICAVDDSSCEILELPVAGLMSLNKGEEVAIQYKKINEKAHEMGTNLKAPFMTMAFMPLLVIPKLKISDKGLFDVEKFEITSLFTE